MVGKRIGPNTHERNCDQLRAKFAIRNDLAHADTFEGCPWSGPLEMVKNLIGYAYRARIAEDTLGGRGRLIYSGSRSKNTASIPKLGKFDMPGYTPLKKFQVTYRNRTGDMTMRTTTAEGADNRTVESEFEAQGYQVIAVVYQGFVLGKSVRTY